MQKFCAFVIAVWSRKNCLENRISEDVVENFYNHLLLVFDFLDFHYVRDYRTF